MLKKLTEFIENKMQFFKRNNTTNNYILPQSYYLGLSTTPIGKDGSGFIEPLGESYKRVEVPSSHFTGAYNGTTTNSVEISFPESNESWGTIVGWGLFASEEKDGKLYFYENLGSIDNDGTITIEEKTIVIIPKGGLQVTIH